MDKYPTMEAQSLQEVYGILQTLQNNSSYVVENKGSFFKNRTIKPEFFFRGQSKTEFQLEPGLFRKRVLDEKRRVGMYPRSLERIIIDEFISESCIYKPEIRQDDFLSWMEIAQHHGLPTRLLDLTSNPLVALYFACISDENEDAYLWIVNREAYNRYVKEKNDVVDINEHSQIEKIVKDEVIDTITESHSGNQEYIQLPRIYKPHYYDERMAAQSSMFMIWAASQTSLDELLGNPTLWMNNDDKQNPKGIIGRIKISSEKKKDILLQLDISGINEKTVYLGLDGVGRYLCQKYKNSGNETEMCTDYQQIKSGDCTITLTELRK